MLLAGVAIAGMIGAPARYLVDGFVLDRTGTRLPFGTLVINITGSFILGFLTGLALYQAFPATPRTILGSGFCGAYTTFSTFTFETVVLAEQRAVRAAFATLFLSVLLPATAAALGLALASA